LESPVFVVQSPSITLISTKNFNELISGGMTNTEMINVQSNQHNWLA
jgi:hypothetical protein